MSADQQKRPPNYKRRAFGIVLGFSPLLLLLASLMAETAPSQRSNLAATGLMIVAMAIALLNFHLSFIRPRLYLSRHGSMDGFRFISIFPIIGTVLTVFGALFGFGVASSALIGIAAFVLDTGGSGWIVVQTWRHQSLWDG